MALRQRGNRKRSWYQYDHTEQDWPKKRRRTLLMNANDNDKENKPYKFIYNSMDHKDFKFNLPSNQLKYNQLYKTPKPKPNAS